MDYLHLIRVPLLLLCTLMPFSFPTATPPSISMQTLTTTCSKSSDAFHLSGSVSLNLLHMFPREKFSDALRLEDE